MAVVKSYVSERGTRIEFCDDAYAGCSEEELERRREEIRRAAWSCWRSLHKKSAAGEGYSDDARKGVGKNSVNSIPRGEGEVNERRRNK